MFALFAVIAVAFVSLVLEIFFGIPVVTRIKDALDALIARSWGIVKAIALLVGISYAIGALVGITFFDLNTGIAEVATMWMTIFLGGLVACFFSVGGDLSKIGKSFFLGTKVKGRPEVKISTSVIFISAVVGSLGSLFATFGN